MNSATPSVQGASYLNSSERRRVIDEAGKAADEFVRLFYETLGKKPHRAHQLYLDSAVLIWDGNPYVNSDAIKKFYDNIPSLTFSVSTMDAQPLGKEAVGDQKSLLISVGGTVRISGEGQRLFSQTFVITASGDKWRIASDTYRSQVYPKP